MIATARLTKNIDQYREEVDTRAVDIDAERQCEPLGTAGFQFGVPVVGFGEAEFEDVGVLDFPTLCF